MTPLLVVVALPFVILLLVAIGEAYDVVRGRRLRDGEDY